LKQRRATVTVVRPRENVVDEDAANAEALYLFNTDPIGNIVAFCAHFSTPVTPPNVAELFHRFDGFSPVKLATFLLTPGNEAFCRAFFDGFDLQCDFLVCLRRCLCGKFALPPEHEAFERAIRAVATAFIAQNPTVFQSVDNAVTLAYAFVMTNTKLTAAKGRIGRDEFLAKTVPVLAGSSITPLQLGTMFDALAKAPFFFRGGGDFMTACAPILRGWLKKREGRFGSRAKNRFCVLAGACLYYFKDNTPASEDKPLGMIQLTSVGIIFDTTVPLKFAVVTTATELQIVKFKKGPPKIVRGIKKIEFEARTVEIREKWSSRLAKSVSLSGLMTEDGETPSLSGP
jgi:hypothetical protein